MDMSQKTGLYRQSYCGCIYSEQERYDKSFKKKKSLKDKLNMLESSNL
ncbi:MAG: epoxyqueuosine reductase QueH [Thermodesulfobacteriota bacterium]